MDVDRDADGGSVFSAAGGESAACAEHHTCLQSRSSNPETQEHIQHVNPTAMSRSDV